jgi:hypothetical protein
MHIVSVAVLSVGTGRELIGSIVRVAQLGQVRKFDQDMRAALSATLSRISAVTNADWRSIGISTYHPRGILIFRKLRLVDQLRLGTGPVVPAMCRPGAGIVGRAYEEQDFRSTNWELVYKDAMSGGLREWNERSRYDSYQLTWGQVSCTDGFSWIAACPVFSEGGKLLGVVSADASTDLSITEVRIILRNLAGTMGRIGPPPASWWSFVAHKAGV